MKRFANMLMVLGVNAVVAQTPAATTSVEPRHSANPNAPEITFEQTTHDFGTLKKGSSVTYKFGYTNTGKEPLVINNCFAGCHCTKPKCSKEPLAPGKTGFIEVHYDSTLVGSFSKNILVSSNANTPVVTLVIRGTVEDMTDGISGTLKEKKTKKGTAKKAE